MQSVSGADITVKPFHSDAVGFPGGSLVMTFDGTRHTRLRGRIGESVLKVEDAAFSEGLQVGDALTVFSPFPMTLTSVLSDNGAQTLGIEPYEAEVAYPVGSLLATLDNRVRLPLHREIPAGRSVTSVTVSGFASDEFVTLSRQDKAYQIPSLKIQSVDLLRDRVYLDDNFLVYPGTHRIMIVSGSSTLVRG